MIAPCQGCGQRNRIPDNAPTRLGGPTVPRYRCGRCTREFTMEELLKTSIAQAFGEQCARVEWDDGSGFDTGPHR